MPDPVSIVTGIAGVVNTGFKAAQGLYQIADGIGSAGLEVRIYAKEITSFSKVLQLIKEKVVRPAGVTEDELVLVKEITDICEEVLAPLVRIQETLKPLLDRYKDSKKKFEQFGKRVHWYFSQKQKLLFYREALRGHRQNLDTVLAAMNYDATRDIVNQIGLRNTLLEGVSMMSGFQGGVHRQLEFQSQIPAGFIEADIEDETVEENATHPTGGKPSETMPGERLHDSDQFTELEMQEIDNAVDTDLDPDQGSSALIVWEDIRVTSRKTKKFAEAVLKNTEEGTTASSPIRNPSLFREDTSSIKNEKANSNPRARSTVEEELRSSFGDSRPQSFREETHRTDSPSGTLQVPDISDRTTRPSVDIQTPYNNDPQKQKTITLKIPKNSDFDTLELPFQYVETWKGIVSMMRSAYFGDSNVERSLLGGDDRFRYDAIKNLGFTLRGPQNQVILPQVWETVVQPGWQITLAFNHPSLGVHPTEEKSKVVMAKKSGMRKKFGSWFRDE